MKQINKTTKVHFEIFKKAFSHYQDLFELNNYHVLFYHEGQKNSYARTITDNDHHVVRVSLNISWSEREITEKELQHVALHECLHLLISKLAWLGTCRYVTDLEIDTADEELVVKMTNILGRLL